MAHTPYLSRRALWLNRLSDEVVNGVTQRIRSGELAAGAPLPQREALMVEFLTSASVIERAVETLVEEGLARRGEDGVFRVAAAPRRLELEFPDASAATRADVIAILELRVGLEAEAAALAAARRTEARLATIREAEGAFEAAVAAGAGVAQADFRFHFAIAQATGNSYLRELTEYLGPLLIPRMRMKLKPAQGPDTKLAQSEAEHRAVVEAIAASDPVTARRAMRAHLERTLDFVRSVKPAD